MNLPDHLRAKLRALPDQPGCYLMRDRRGTIVYVGKARSLRKRVQSYFREASLRRGAPKLRSLVNSIWDLETVVVRTEAEAALTESKLIKDYKPRFNVSFRDDKRFLLLRAEARQPVPRFTLCRIQREDGALYFGPYPTAAVVRAALDFTEKRFGIRKCAPLVPDEQAYRHCLNDIIRHCAAPCIGKVSLAQYRERFDEACAFLRGARPAVIEGLREAMRAASAALDFERAAALRDTLLALEAVVRRRARVASTPALRAEAARAGVRDLQRHLGLARPPRAIEAFDISGISGTLCVASLVRAEDGLPRRHRYRRFRIRTVEGVDDPGMMAEVIRRRFDDVAAAGQGAPDLVLVDGGVAQVRAARNELAKLGLTEVPVAGLAKQFEEIHWLPGRPPLRLPADAPALQVLQRLRDEAHRFALDYHRRLRRRRIRESVLDEIPGIGDKRREALLKHLGSVRRMAQASAAEIAAVPGVGPQLAREIKAHLESSGTGLPVNEG